MTNSPKNESRHPGEFIARYGSRLAADFSIDKGVLHADATSLGDGALLRLDGDLLRAWTGTGTIVGILLEPDIAEIESGRNRVVFAARDCGLILSKITIPEGFETEALNGLAALGFLNSTNQPLV